MHCSQKERVCQGSGTLQSNLHVGMVQAVGKGHKSRPGQALAKGSSCK